MNIFQISKYKLVVKIMTRSVISLIIFVVLIKSLISVSMLRYVREKIACLNTMVVKKLMNIMMVMIVKKVW
jgi:hypothetical protein